MRKTFATARYGFSRPRPFASASSISPALQQHADVEVQVTGIDAETLRELAVRELPVAFLAEHLEDAHPQRMSERLELFRLVEDQRCVLHVDPPFVCPGAVLHIEGGLSSRQLGCSSAIEDCSGSPARGPNEARRASRGSVRSANARRAASAFSAPPSAKTITRALVSAGMDSVTRSTNGSSPGSAGSDASSLLVQRRRVREERRDVAVGPDAEQREVEHRVAELALVVGCRALLAELALDPVHLTRRRAEAVEQRAFRERGSSSARRPAARSARRSTRARRCSSRARASAACSYASAGALPPVERDVPAASAQPAASRSATARCDRVGVVDDDELDVGHRSPAASSLRTLHRCLDRVQERGAHACLLELADRANRRAARRGDRLAQLDRMHLLVAQQLRRAEHRLDDELRRDLAREPEQDARPRSSPRRAARSTPGPSRRRR